MWQFTDGAGNAQGLTISEFGEVGGPLSTSCPAAELILPTEIVVAGNTVKWNPAVNLPGAVAYTSYQVEVVKSPGTLPADLSLV